MAAEESGSGVGTGGRESGGPGGVTANDDSRGQTADGCRWEKELRG